MNDLFIKGGPLMWPLLACSIIALMVTLERLLWSSRRALSTNTKAAQKIIRLVEAKQHDEALPLAQTHPNCPICCVLLTGLQHAASGKLAQAMELEAGRQIKQEKRGINVLDTIVTVAPLLGILGTVLGIIDSFDLLSDAGIQNPQAVLGGIAQALITTATGLSVAVMSLLPMNYFLSKLQKQAEQISDFATQLELHICTPPVNSEVSDAD
ncbi:MAG: MotA/TolQ/ExbB proton channel family protein [Phycisphaeraceae bacterium]|nr:MotA/TolQ/ExbB proton channel family protein [Phycisphaeraceae bacterium]